mgnify:CR=1 FL=1
MVVAVVDVAAVVEVVVVVDVAGVVEVVAVVVAGVVEVVAVVVGVAGVDGVDACVVAPNTGVLSMTPEMLSPFNASINLVGCWMFFSRNCGAYLRKSFPISLNVVRVPFFISFTVWRHFEH